MYVYTYIYICVCVCVCVYTYMYICMYVYTGQSHDLAAAVYHTPAPPLHLTASRGARESGGVWRRASGP